MNVYSFSELHRAITDLRKAIALFESLGFDQYHEGMRVLTHKLAILENR